MQKPKMQPPYSLLRQDSKALQAKIKELSKQNPVDSNRLVMLVMGLLGCGTLLAYNTLITCTDYFEMRFPTHHNIEFLLLPFNTVPNILSLGLMVPLGHRFSFTSRIVALFSLSAVLVAIIPVIAEFTHPDVGFVLFMGIVAILGMLSAILQSSVFGFGGLLPPEYIQSAVTGQAVAGVSVCILRILTKTIEANTPAGKQQGAYIYFSISAGINLLCAIMFVYALRRSFTKHHLEMYQSKKNLEELLKKERFVKRGGSASNVLSIHKFVAESAPDALPNLPPRDSERRLLPDDSSDDLIVNAAPADLRTPPISPAEKGGGGETGLSVYAVFRKIRLLCGTVFAIFLLTFLVFPGLTVNIPSQYGMIKRDGWMPVLLITEFNVWDMIARFFVVSKTTMGFTPSTLWFGAALRFLLYPTYVIMSKGMFVSDVFAHILVAATALTNGHQCCLAMMWAPQRCDTHEREVASSMMAFFLVGGITAGSVISLGLSFVL